MSDLIPAGYYAAVGVPVQTDEGQVWAQFGRSQNKGTPQVFVAFALLDGPHAGRRLGWFGYFTEGSADRTIESLRLCGLKGDDLANAIKGPLDQEVQLVLEHEEYEGKKRVKVSWVNAPGGGAFKMANPMNAQELRQFAAKFKSNVKAKPEVTGDRKTAPAPTAPAKPAETESPPADTWGGGDAPPPHDDSEIPF
jgi:hypothetical protein